MICHVIQLTLHRETVAAAHVVHFQYMFLWSDLTQGRRGRRPAISHFLCDRMALVSVSPLVLSRSLSCHDNRLGDS